jgi:hypothetical protein
MTGTLLQIPLSGGAKVNREITFRLFQEGDAEAFRELNEEWIARYFKVEEQDLIQLNDPAGNILQPGGQIVMATADGKRIGCCARFCKDRRFRSREDGRLRVLSQSGNRPQTASVHDRGGEEARGTHTGIGQQHKTRQRRPSV